MVEPKAAPPTRRRPLTIRDEVPVLQPTRTADPAAGATDRPRLRAVVRHLGVSILWANLVPGVLFYACFAVGNIWAALGVALGWCYGAMLWRACTGRRTSGLLWLVAAGLTAKTALTVATGSTFVYFVQPAFSDAGVGLLFLLSLATARPVVARLAGDFFPMNDEVAGRPRVKQLLRRLTLLWALICLVKAGTTVWLLNTMSTVTFVEVKTVLTPAIVAAGAAVTVYVAARVARSEGLLHVAVAPA